MQNTKEKCMITIKPIAPSAELKAKAAQELIKDAKKYQLTPRQEDNLHQSAAQFLKMVLK